MQAWQSYAMRMGATLTAVALLMLLGAWLTGCSTLWTESPKSPLTETGLMLLAGALVMALRGVERVDRDLT